MFYMIKPFQTPKQNLYFAKEEKKEKKTSPTEK